MKECNAVTFLPDLNMIVINTAAQTLKLIEFMIMRRENSSCIKNIRVNDIFDYSPGDRQSVIGTRTSSDLIEKKKASAGSILKDIRYFLHLDHER